MKFKKSLLTLSIIAITSTLTACGGGSSGSDTPDTTPVTPTTPTTPTTPSNSAPTAITLNNSSVDENTYGAIVGDLSVEDPDNDDTHTLSVNSEIFTIAGTTLKLLEGVSLDADNGSTQLSVNVTATDAGGESYSTSLTVDINNLMDRYNFDSQFNAEESSVSYSGQIARHALIAELNHYINTQLQDELDDGTLTTRQDVLNRLNLYFRTTELQYPDLAINFLENAEQNLISDISGSHKNLVGKLAGNDTGGQHEDWNNGAFAGWNVRGSTTPEDLVDILFGMLADNAVAHLNGTIRQDFNGNDITKVYITTDGKDLKQLIQKFLLMAIPFSQGTDDYLGSDTDGKGLKTNNNQSTGKAYSNLEHQFDEGFGYFGAAVNYLEYTDTEISGKVSGDNGRTDWNSYHDTDGNGSINLKSEYNWGQSVNAAKRDRGTASNSNPTDFTKQVMDAFLAGRKLINDNAGSALTTDQQAQLEQHAATAVDAWERAIVATVIHYINDTHADLGTIGSDEFSFADLAKHHSEMKGFALGIQFNERSQLSDDDFETVHQLMGTAPVMQGDVAAYRDGLLQARSILQNAYGFNAENVENW